MENSQSDKGCDLASECSDEERFSSGKKQKDNAQGKVESHIDIESSVRLLRNGKVRVIEPAQRKTKKQSAAVGRNESQSNLFTTEIPLSEDLANANKAKLPVPFSEEEEHKKLLNLLQEQRCFLQSKAVHNKTENLHGIENEDVKIDKLESGEINSAMHELEDDEPLSKFLKHEVSIKDQKKAASQDVEDDEPLVRMLRKVKGSKKKSKVIETSLSISRQVSATELSIGVATQISLEAESNATSLEGKITSSGDSFLLSLKGNSVMVEHSSLKDILPRENESSALIDASSTASDSAPLVQGTISEGRIAKDVTGEQMRASLTVDDHKVDVSATLHQELAGEKELHNEMPLKLELHKQPVQEIERTTEKRKSKSSKAVEVSAGKSRVQLDEPSYVSHKKPKLLSSDKSRNIINKRINAGSIAESQIFEVSCPEVVAAQERKMASDNELKALQEELHPLMIERSQGDRKDLANDLIEKWINVICTSLHTSFDANMAIIQHLLCHSHGACDK